MPETGLVDCAFDFLLSLLYMSWVWCLLILSIFLSLFIIRATFSSQFQWRTIFTMLFCRFLALSALALDSISASPVAGGHPHKQCHNSPQNRACWGSHSISTNYYDVIPNTGRTVTVRLVQYQANVGGCYQGPQYNLDIVNTTAFPDGVGRPVMLVNGMFPGPTIEANWGDHVGMASSIRLVELRWLIALKSSMSPIACPTTAPPFISMVSVNSTPTKWTAFRPSRNAL